MKSKLIFALAVSLITAGVGRAQQSLDALVDRELPQLVSTYKALHAAPELSHYEAKTSAFLAQQLRALGYEVTENVGKYDRPEWKPYGVVAVLKNGAGPTVLVRSDMDALPLKKRPACLTPAQSRPKTMRGRK